MILKEGIEYIGNQSFGNCSNLEKLELPGSIEELDAGAFTSCSSLKTVVCNNGIKKIGPGAFSDCEKLESIELPSSLTELGAGAFGGCKTFTEFAIPDSIQTIGSGLFANCDNLTKVTIGSSATNVSKKLLQNCSTVKKVINNSSKAVYLDNAKNNRTWYVKKKKVTKVPAGKTATAKGKKYKITYNTNGGKIKGKAVKSYCYGNKVSLPMNVKRKGATFFGWGIPYDTLEPGRKGNCKLNAVWKIYSVKNIKGQKFKVYAQDADYKKKGYEPSEDFYGVRYSENENMEDCKYFWGTAQNDAKNAGCSPQLELGKTYYVEIMCVPSSYDDLDVELEYDTIGAGWLGKRKVTITK